MEFPSENDKKAYKKAKNKLRRDKLILLIIMVVLCIITVRTELPFLYIVSIIAFFSFWWIISGFEKALKRSFCPKCHAHYDYEEDIGWQVVDETVSSYETGANKKANVEFICSCPNCGHEKTFTKKFTVATVTSSGNVKHFDIRTLAKKYFF